MRQVVLALLGLMFAANSTLPIVAQDDAGALYGRVKDTDGAVLQGVSVELEGLGAPRQRVTDELGAFRFLGLDPGLYRLKASLHGFSTVEVRDVTVQLAQSSTIEVVMPLAVEEAITVISESPLMDERMITTGENFSSVDLDTIPVTRTVWALASQVPGVLPDQVNVGGSEGGYTSNFRAPGIGFQDNTYLMDGVDIGDMTTIGVAGSHLDVHQFSEVQFVVSGADVTRATAGVSINLVTKRGSNEFRGSARFYRTDDRFFGWQSSKPAVLVQPDSDLAEDQPSFIGNAVDQIDDYGFEAGGPVLRDRLWFWGAFGTVDYALRSGGTTVEDVQPVGSTFPFAAFKLNAQIAAANSLVASWNHSDHQRFGLGAGVSRSRESTWNQRGPTPIYKLEDSHVVTPSLFLSGAYGRTDENFGVFTQACIADGGDCAAAREALWDADGVWRHGFVSGFSNRPSEQLKLDGSYFFNTGDGGHELKFGGRLREFEVRSVFAWPGRNLFIIDLDPFGIPGNFEQVVGQGGTVGPPTSTRYTSVWAQDTITLGRWTINVGLRYDLQQGKNEPTISQGNPTFPEVLPAIDYAGEDAPFDWSTITPRFGVTYALGEERETLLRASFSQFAQQLGSAAIYHLNPAGVRYGYYYFVDVNENLILDEEDSVPTFSGYCYGCPPDYVSAVSPNRTDADLSPEITTEGLVEIQHAFLPELVISASYTYRNRSDISWERPLVWLPDGSIRPGVARDWLPDGSRSVRLPDGSTAMVDVFRLDPSLEPTGGTLLANSDRSVTFNGLTLTATKRLSNQWMLRGFLQYGEGTWNVPESFILEDNPNPDELASDVDGALFVAGSGNPRNSNVFMQATWSWNLNGMVQIAPDRPFGFNIAANLFGREGYPLPYYLTYNARDGLPNQNLSILNGDLGRFRADDVFTTDLRLEKELATSAHLGFTFSADIFNIFDSASVMQRERRWGNRYDWLDQTLGPRVWRLGVRIDWR